MVEEKKAKKTAKKTKTQEREKAENIDKIVVELAKKGNTPSKIGIILRDKHNIQNMKVLGKKITKILKENNIEYLNDLDLVNKRIDNINKHLENNRQDKRAKRELVKFVGLRKKLEKYNLKHESF